MKFYDINNIKIELNLNNKEMKRDYLFISERGDLFVLNKYKGTAVLVEAGFISNASDLNTMTTNSEQIGIDIATGIINYLSK